MPTPSCSTTRTATPTADRRRVCANEPVDHRFHGDWDATPVYGDDTIYLVQVSNTQINGLVAGVDGIIGNADDQLALQFIIDPSTGSVTVEQFLAIHHNDAGDTPLAYDDLATNVRRR